MQRLIAPLRTRTPNTNQCKSFTFQTSAKCFSVNKIRYNSSKPLPTVQFSKGIEIKFPSRTFSSAAERPEPAYSTSELANRAQNANLLRYITAYRRYGHIIADLDPLKLQQQIIPPELDITRYGLENVPPEKKFPLKGLIHIPGKNEATLPEIIDHLQKSYCHKIASEFLLIQEVNQRRWFSDMMESLSSITISNEERVRIYQLMAEAEAFDHFMQKKFPFVKRYALEGNEAMIPAIDAIFCQAANNGVKHVVIGMPHRGRLNFLVGLLRYPPKNMFWKVKGNSEFPEGIVGIGDVLSHIGTSVDMEYGGKTLHVTLLQNPSHLEAIDPVAMGQVRALQELKTDKDREEVMCLMIHGDAAFYGQGTVAETLGLSKLPEFTVGGTIHLIVNNQLGFTTPAMHGRSSRYSADLGKIIDSPAIHVNADEPEDVVKASRIAIDFRTKFKSDIILDLIGYRRHGHNELDEPSFTQPIMYKVIRSRPSVVKLYGAKMEDQGLLSSSEASEFIRKCDLHLSQELESIGPINSTDQHLRGRWAGLVQTRDITLPIQTGKDTKMLKDIGVKSTEIPGNTMQIHERLRRTFAKSRVDSIEKNQIDWATAEAMAFGSLLLEGHPIRLCGQDSGRGTFSQRHAELVDQETEKRYVPLNHLSSNQGLLEIVNSPLSELAVMAYEYGYSITDPNTLCIWEAQFGDFANGAQITIDQFVSSGESKWLKQSGIVLLLPHGYDGAGPEHSNSRMERFLQLVDLDEINPHNPINKNPNMRIVNLTTPANYFHALRRQLKTNYRKPLVVMAPKTLLRHAKANSILEDMGPGSHFLPVIGDHDVEPDGVERVIFCSGKVFVDLLQEREKRGYNKNTAIVRIEELSPFPTAQVEAELKRYKNAKKHYWVQDESQNAGAWGFVRPRFSHLTQLQYIGRPPCPASAVGISAIHSKETAAIFDAAFPK